jgi:hypothetical protein
MLMKVLVPLTLAAAAIAIPAGAGAGTTTVDFGVTVTGPPTAKAKVGSETTYTVAVTNAGPDTEGAHVRLTGGKGASDAETGEPVKVLSVDATQGSCKDDGFGATCRLGDIAPGATATVTVVIEPLERDVPNLDLQATVDPERAAVVDASAANNHVELDTEVPEPIKIEGVPNRCTSNAFVIRVRARVGTLAKLTKLEVDNKVLGSSTKNRLKVKVNPDDIGPGNHKLSVVVQSSGPPLATLKDSFKTCEA